MKKESALPGISHLDFDLVCSCRTREIISPAKFFGLIPPRLSDYSKCGHVARYSAVSRCCGDQVLLCRSHRLSTGQWNCLKCRHSAPSVDAALVVYAF